LRSIAKRSFSRFASFRFNVIPLRLCYPFPLGYGIPFFSPRGLDLKVEILFSSLLSFPLFFFSSCVDNNGLDAYDSVSHVALWGLVPSNRMIVLLSKESCVLSPPPRWGIKPALPLSLKKLVRHGFARAIAQVPGEKFNFPSSP